jgi:microcystin-dependent protein
MSEQFLSELRIMSFGFAPIGWIQCNGQLLPINQNQALFSLLGTFYGGDGRSNFALPNLQGRVPVHRGAGYNLGQASGETGHTLNISEMATHRHLMQATAVTATAAVPTSNDYLGQGKTTSSGAPAVNLYSTSQTSDVAFAAGALSNSGGGQAHENRQPFLALNICIALQGIFPTQN